MSVDPASWQPGTIVVNRDGTQAVTLVARQDKPRWYVIGRGLDGTDRWWILDAELAESWQPLADVVARGWEQRQEVPVRWCLTHNLIWTLYEHRKNSPNPQCDRASSLDRDKCVPSEPLSYPIPEGDETMSGYWNGEPAECRRLFVKVGPSPVSTWWCAPLVGYRRAAVEVVYGDQRFFLDNEDGSGWFKVTEGRGSPRWSHRSLPDSSEIVP